jgi:hypothetical protein
MCRRPAVQAAGGGGVLRMVWAKARFPSGNLNVAFTDVPPGPHPHRAQPPRSRPSPGHHVDLPRFDKGDLSGSSEPSASRASSDARSGSSFFITSHSAGLAIGHARPTSAVFPSGTAYLRTEIEARTQARFKAEQAE